MIDVDFIDNMPKFSNTIVHKAANCIVTQLESLYYAPNFGMDLKRFFDPDVEIQTETFKAYTIQQLTDNGVNVISLRDKAKTFERLFDYVVSQQTSTGLVAE